MRAYKMYKTSKKQRANYVYTTATGEAITLTPDDVGEAWITFLHEDENAMVDANRREQYHVPARYDTLTGEDGDDKATAIINLMEDPSPDPLALVLEQELSCELLEAIQTLKPEQIDLLREVFFNERTRTDIAAEEGVAEATIRYRLDKIYAALRKHLTR